MITIARVLLVDDGESSVSVLQNVIESAGHAVLRTDSIDETARRLGAGGADIVVLPSALVQSLDRLVATQCGSAPATFIVVADEPSLILARTALRAGATEVIDRAAGESALLVAIERAAREGQLTRELAMLRARIGDAAQRSLIGRSAATTCLREVVGRAAASRAPVLVVGEVGTGKSVVARLVHDLSARATRPLLTMRCAGVDAAALERELFGCAASEGGRGARAGLLEEARGGTIVLDDAPALPSALRVSLARASASRSARRAGASDSYPTDFRLVLTARVTSGESDCFAVEDLLARFNALLIEVPPLRERRSDIPQLVQHFRQRLAGEQGLELSPLAPDAMLPLLGGEWTGNVRELEHWVERSALAARLEQGSGASALRDVDLGTSEVTLEQLERAYILHVLALESGHQSRAAVRLGIDRRTLYRKLKQYRGKGAPVS
ncbi:MAG TPA: sigma 54-interacting transcriptional regulator [Gemmatimonadaceae bacterium]|nr:sigma 54-interacting transcriptional regulator [Gemmatimonadaceae bacterium]